MKNIEAAVFDEKNDDLLNECDRLYYQVGEDIATQLFGFIKTNRGAVTL